MLDVKLSGLKNVINKVHVLENVHKSRFVGAKLGDLVVEQIRANIEAGKKPSGGAQRPSRRFGETVSPPLIFRRRLINSLRAVVMPDGIRVLSHAKHAGVQNEGRVLKPRNKKYLIIPFHRFVWEALRKESARTAFPDAKIIKRGWQLFLMQNGRALGVLQKWVHVPARPFGDLSFDQRLKVGRALDREYTRAWKEAR